MSLPNVSQKITKPDNTVTVSWYRFFLDLQRRLSSGGTSTSVDVEFSATCTASESVGDPVYVSSPGVVTLADASAEATAGVVGFVASKTTSTDCKVRTNGILGGFSGLTTGSTYFLSETTGSITVNPVTTPGAVLFPVGMALSSTELILTVSNQDYVIRS